MVHQFTVICGCGAHSQGSSRNPAPSHGVPGQSIGPKHPDYIWCWLPSQRT